MFYALDNIYRKLYQNNPRYSVLELDTTHILLWLQQQIKSTNLSDAIAIYNELSEAVKSLQEIQIPMSFIERFCLAKLSEKIQAAYAVNVAEAYALAYIVFNSPIDLHTIYFKLGTSGLLVPTLINNEKVQDIEAIAKFIIDNLQQTNLITIAGLYVSLGREFDQTCLKL